MITKVRKCRNFGVFHDFSWSSDVPEFKQFNLIYGWNRSGKTTLSRVFSACEKRSTSFKEYPKNGEFEIKMNDGSNIKNTDLENCNLPLKVFNKDFIDENISFDPSNPCKPIVYVSEEDIKTKENLEDLKQVNGKLITDFESAQKEKLKSESSEERFRIATAQNIKTIIGNLRVRDKFYDYNKSHVKTILDNIGIDNFAKLSDEDFDKYKRAIGSEAKHRLNIFSQYELNFPFGEQNISSFDAAYTVIEGLLSRKVISETLDRLKDDQDLNSWVKQGFDLQKKKEETTKCLFCQKPFDTDFWESLSKHFSDDYENLQTSIKTFIVGIETLKKDKFDEKKGDLYSDFQNDYQIQLKNINQLIDELNKWVDEAIRKLQEKFKNPLAVVDLPRKVKDFKGIYGQIIDELNKIIKEHNTKVDNHETEVRITKEKLEKHLIAVAIEAQDYRTIKRDLEKSIEVERLAKERLMANQAAIKELERKTSNIGKAVQKINKHLEEFFGRKEIQLELDDNKKGYAIKRDNELATNLSEGEKTAIAFSYFIVKTQERNFKIKDGIIFIDDPISSFDLSFIYHCFSLIKNHFNEARQLFISTHNFQLFNLVKDWFLNKRKNEEVCKFFMIENIVKDSKRHAFIKQLDETLRKFKSEYHFLFARLNLFVKQETHEYADFYIIGNIARRFLEIFINFKIPTTGDLSSKIKQLDIKTISDTEKDRVYKLINEFSHGSDPTSTIEHKDKKESQEAIKLLLNIVKESDPKHFELLEKNL